MPVVVRCRGTVAAERTVLEGSIKVKLKIHKNVNFEGLVALNLDFEKFFFCSKFLLKKSF